MKSVVAMPMLRYYNFPISQIMPSNVFIFSIGESERIRSFLLGAHANVNGALITPAGA